VSGDEVFALLAGGAMGVWAWFGWYLNAASVIRLGAPTRGKFAIWLWPLVCIAVLFAVLKTMSSFDVRDDVLYLTMYMVIGAGWLGAVVKFLPMIGLNPREDILERANAAAVPAVAGALLGFTLCFAGGNIGDGPGWWVVIGSATLATATLVLLVLLFDRATGIIDIVTIDRDRAAGVRLGGLFIAAGVILGRGVAGDFVSTGATVRDFVTMAWPVLVLFAIAALVERGARPTMEHPVRSITLAGLPAAALYLLISIGYAVSLGPT
jgi:uncharacterized membrane protein YjfL (UPF0719 family)